MTTKFHEALDQIKDRIPQLERRDERAVEVFVILPLLKRLGWNTEDPDQIYPQMEMSEDKRNTVDYALQIDGKSKVFIEAKQWNTTLDKGHEAQLLGYYNAAREKPELTVLTSGRQWRLYLRPVKRRRRGQEPALRLFRVFDIVKDEPAEVENDFKRFLSRKRMVSIDSIVTAAAKRHKEIERVETVRSALRNALDEMANKRDTLGEVLTALVEKTNPEIHPSEDLVNQFIRSRVMEITVVSPSKLKPTSFTFRANGKKQRIDVSSWSQLKTEFCNLMAELQADNFNDTVLEKLGDWFYKSEPNDKSHMRIGETGISVNDRRSEKAVRELSLKLLAAFRYPEDALTVKTNQP